MRDLDMSDVIADAREMMDQHYAQMWFELDRLSDVELQQARYNRGAEAREGDFDAIMLVTCVDILLLHRTTTLCEGCLGRYGCDMCCPSDFDFTSYDYPSYSEADDHFERFGRPAFPNEY